MLRCWVLASAFALISIQLLPIAHATYSTPTASTTVINAPCDNHFQNVGPFHVLQSYPNINGLDNPEDIGAVHELWYPGSGDTAYLGAVNGGVWKTDTFHQTPAFGGPHWYPISDYMPCISIASLAGSKGDPNFLVAGCGYVSNGARRGGEALGAMVSTDAGASWHMSGLPKGFSICSILVSGSATGSSVILVASNFIKIAISGTTGNGINSYNIPYDTSGLIQQGGIWRSTDRGATFVNVFKYPVSKLVRHPTTSTTVYATELKGSDDMDTPSMVASLKISTDEGSTWNDLPSQPNVVNICPQGQAIDNTVFSISVVGSTTTLFAGFFVTTNAAYNCYAFFRSTNGGSTWTTITGVPAKGSGLDLGSQGQTNLAILADPNLSYYLYVGATDRVVFRVDTRATPNTWQLIASPQIIPSSDKPPGTFTASTTAPHADTRNLYYDASTGNLLITNDGGVYKRTSPASSPSAGDWSTLSGDLAISESYQAAYDEISHAIILGAQDNSLMISQFDGTESSSGIWGYTLTGDGSSVGVDQSTTPTTFYGADQFMGGYFSIPVGGGLSNQNTFGATLGTSACGWNADASDAACWHFRTAQAINLITSSHILLCTVKDGRCYKLTYPATNSVLEFNPNIVPGIVSGGVVSDAFGQYVYGGRRNGVSYPDVVLAAAESYIWCRTISSSTASISVGDFTANAPSNLNNYVNTNVKWATHVYTSFLAQHPADFWINTIIDDAGHVFLTTNFGRTFVDLNLAANSNLLSLSGHTTVDTFETGSAIFIQNWVGGVCPLLVATSFGLWISFTPIYSGRTPSFLTFQRFSAGMPHTIVTSMQYSYANDVLVASTFGRGVWVLQGVSGSLQQAYSGVDTSVATASCLVPAYPNVNGAFQYNAAGGVSPQLSDAIPSPRPAFNYTQYSTTNGPASNTPSSTGGSGGDGGGSTTSTGTNGGGTTVGSSTGAANGVVYDPTASITVSFNLEYSCGAIVNAQQRLGSDLLNALSNVVSSQITVLSWGCGATNDITKVEVRFSYADAAHATPGDMLSQLTRKAKDYTSAVYDGFYLQYIIASTIVQTSGPVCFTCAAVSSAQMSSWLLATLILTAVWLQLKRVI